MLSGEAGAARVGRVVNEEGFRAGRDLAAQIIQVDLPALVGQQFVSVKFDA